MTLHPPGVILIRPLMWITMIAAMMIVHQAGVNPWPTAVADVRKGGRRRAMSTAMTHHLAGAILLGPPAARADVGQSGALVIVIVIVAVTVMLWTSGAAGGAVDHTTSVAAHARSAAALVSVPVTVIASPPMTARSVIGPRLVTAAVRLRCRRPRHRRRPHRHHPLLRRCRRHLAGKACVGLM